MDWGEVKYCSSIENNFCQLDRQGITRIRAFRASPHFPYFESSIKKIFALKKKPSLILFKNFFFCNSCQTAKMLIFQSNPSDDWYFVSLQVLNLQGQFLHFVLLVRICSMSLSVDRHRQFNKYVTYIQTN